MKKEDLAAKFLRNLLVSLSIRALQKHRPVVRRKHPIRHLVVNQKNHQANLLVANRKEKFLIQLRKDLSLLVAKMKRIRNRTAARKVGLNPHQSRKQSLVVVAGQQRSLVVIKRKLLKNLALDAAQTKQPLGQLRKQDAVQLMEASQLTVDASESRGKFVCVL
jgi:hypothetical protein